MTIEDVLAIARCPACGGELRRNGDIACSACGTGYALEGEIAALVPPAASAGESAEFYAADDEQRFGRDEEGMDPDSDAWVRAFLDELPADATVLEIGAGRGVFAGLHPGHIASDLSLAALRGHRAGPRVQADAAALPFADGAVGAVFSVFALEHVPRPERALREVDRVLAPGGRALLYPAWFVRRWASRGVELRPWRDLSALERVERCTIPLRNTRAWRFARILPGRVRRELALRRGAARLPFDYEERRPNLDAWLGPDSDACNAMDPEAMSAWFVSRGYEDLRRSTLVRRLLYGYEPVDVRKPGS